MYNCGANTGTTARCFVVKAQTGTISDTSTATQNGKNKTLNLLLNGVDNNITINSGVTSFTINTIPSANDFSYNLYVDGATYKSSCTGETNYTYTCGTNTGTTARIINVSAITIGTYDAHKVTQQANAYFYWNKDNTTAITTNDITNTVSSLVENFTTNYDDLTFEISGMVTGKTEGTNNITANFGINPHGGSSRNGKITVKYGNTIVGVWDLSQNAGESL